MDPRYLGTGHAVYQRNTVRQRGLHVLILRPESFFHCSMDLSGHRRITTIEQVLQVSLVRVIREIHQMLKLFLKSIPKEPVVDSCHPGDLNPRDTVELHLIYVEAGADQVDTGCEPFVLGLSFFKSDVTTGLQLGHESVNVLFGHVIDLFS